METVIAAVVGILVGGAACWLVIDIFRQRVIGVSLCLASEKCAAPVVH
jgi:hypothetical protein